MSHIESPNDKKLVNIRISTSQIRDVRTPDQTKDSYRVGDAGPLLILRTTVVGTALSLRSKHNTPKRTLIIPHTTGCIVILNNNFQIQQFKAVSNNRCIKKVSAEQFCQRSLSDVSLTRNQQKVRFLQMSHPTNDWLVKIIIPKPVRTNPES